MQYETKLLFRAIKLPKGFKSQVVKLLPNLKSIERKNESFQHTTIEKLMMETKLEDLETIKKINALCKEKNIVMDYMIENDEQLIFQSSAPGSVFPSLRLKKKEEKKYYKDEYEAATEFIDRYEGKFSKETEKLADKLETIYNSSPDEIDEEIFIEDIIESWNRQENVIKEGLQYEIQYCTQVKVEDLGNT